MVFCARRVPGETVALNSVLLYGDILLKRLFKRLRLFADLLDHEVLVVAFLGGFHVPVHVRRLLFNGVAELVVKLDAALFQHGNLLVLYEAHVPRMREDGRYVRCDDALPVPVTDDHGAVLAGAVDRLRIVRKENGERKRTFQQTHRLFERFERIAAEEIAQQLRHDFRIRFGDELAAAALEHFLKF